jgi:16S rRNA (guanine527-N7)-methyltransferase
MELVKRFFPHFDPHILSQLQALALVFKEINQKVNLISRKDEDSIEAHHILHSLAIAKFVEFVPGTKVFDLGTGGGFPGLVLAIWFPEVNFVLCDSIGKKMDAVAEMISVLQLKNVQCFHGRAETYKGDVDFVVSRAVAPMSTLWGWAKSCIRKKGINSIGNGFILLKGGDLQQECKEWQLLSGRKKFKVHSIQEFFELPYFSEKKVVYLPIQA